MDSKWIEDAGAPNPRQAEVDRIRDAAAASARRARESDRAVPLPTGAEPARDGVQAPGRSRNAD